MQPVSVQLRTWAERPDLAERGPAASEVWPEYNTHGDVFDDWWDPLLDELPDFQFALYDEEADRVLAEGHTGPLAWNGDDDTLPDGIDQALEQAVTARRERRPVTRCARSRPRSRLPRASAGWRASYCAGWASSRSVTDSRA
jgi:hypothetical protein